MQSVEIPSPAIPAGMRIYAIGDIHGRNDLVRELSQKIMNDALDYQGRKLIIFLGDYIDRGRHSKQVIDILSDPNYLPNFEKTFLAGNHEQILLQFLAGDLNVLKNWWRYGAQTTFYSYGVVIAGIPTESKYAILQEQLTKAIPDQHLQFYQTLKSTLTVGDYCFVHAGIKPGVPLQAQHDNQLFWIRDEFLSSTLIHEKMMVHGHTIVKEPQFLPNRIAIDTGAYTTEKLTCLVLEDKTQRLLK